MLRPTKLVVVALLGGGCVDPPPQLPPEQSAQTAAEAPAATPSIDWELKARDLERQNGELSSELDFWKSEAERLALVVDRADAATAPRSSEVRASSRPAVSSPSNPLVAEGATSRATERNDSWWRFAWRVPVRNISATTVRCRLEVEFVDRDGYTIDSDSEYDCELAPGQERIFTGDTLIRAAVAPRVYAVRPKPVPR